MADVRPRDAGVASALVNVSLQISAALGLAALGAIATDRTQTLTAGFTANHALVAGYQLAFVVASACVLATVAVALVVLRAGQRGGRRWGAGPRTASPRERSRGASSARGPAWPAALGLRGAGPSPPHPVSKVARPSHEGRPRRKTEPAAAVASA